MQMAAIAPSVRFAPEPRPSPAICSLLPPVALYLVFVLAPVVVTFILSFAYYDPMLGSHWVGLDKDQPLLH